jgi:cytochrome c biogenesis protein CcdA
VDGQFLFGVSLTASFLAGVLALFAPCCITFLFPAYLGTIFKERKRVIFYTVVFALGLSTILVPVALGFRFFISFFDSFHSQIYYVGALFMIFMGIMTLKPMFHLPQLVKVKAIDNKKINILSVYTLGLVSGITSACCAPVLFAAITLTTLSPSLFQAFFVSLAYVFGIVFPLFILSVSYEKFSSMISGKNRQKTYTIFKYLGSTIFIFSGLAIAIANYLGKIQMYQMEEYSKVVRTVFINVSDGFKNPFLDIGTFVLVVVIFVLLAKRKSKINKEEN